MNVVYGNWLNRSKSLWGRCRDFARTNYLNICRKYQKDFFVKNVIENQQYIKLIYFQNNVSSQLNFGDDTMSICTFQINISVKYFLMSFWQKRQYVLFPFWDYKISTRHQSNNTTVEIVFWETSVTRKVTGADVIHSYCLDVCMCVFIFNLHTMKRYTCIYTYYI